MVVLVYCSLTILARATSTSNLIGASHSGDITAGKLPNAGTADRKAPTRVLSPKDRFGDHVMLLLSYDGTAPKFFNTETSL
jgi:hypothetical protein